MKKQLSYLAFILLFNTLLTNAQTIIGTQPVNNATNVALDANIVFTFDTAIPGTVVNNTTIIVNGSQTGIIAGTFSGGDTNQITFVPTNNFKPNETITISVTAGLGIANPTVFSFITTVPPNPYLVIGERYSKVQQLDLTMNFTVYAADLDGDGDLDIISASRIDNTIVWFENLGLRNFGPPQIISTDVITPENVFVADLDGDGDLDVLSASRGDNKIAWYENDGSGNFSAQKIISTSADTARTVYAADLDGDGDLDVLSASIGDNKIAWYENDGFGNFGPEQIISTAAAGAFSVYAADIDGDGDLDVISGSNNDDKVAWYENDGFGNFGAQNIICSNCDQVWDVRAVDIDGDGHIDIISASFNDHNVRVFKNNGDGTFASPIVLNDGFLNPTSVNATDVDGDGLMDIVVTFASSNRIIWYRQNQSGSFIIQNGLNFDNEKNFQPITQLPIQTFIGDIDGNGDLEVITASFSGGIHIYDALPLAGNQSNPAIPIDRTKIDVSINRDIDPLYVNNENIRIHGSQSGYINATFEIDNPNFRIRIFPNNPFKPGELITVFVSNQIVYRDPINFTVVAPVEIADSGEFISGENIISSQADGAIDVEAGDIDLDGDIDIVSISAIDNKIVWYPNDGSGNFGAEQIISTSINAGRSIFLADLDGDGDLDVVSASANDDKIAWYQNDGSGNFGPQIVISTQVNEPRKVIAADMDGDGDLDIITFTPDAFLTNQNEKVVWFANDGNGNFGSKRTTAIIGNPTSVTDIFVRDVNRDGRPDILVTTTNSSTPTDGAMALINNGVGGFSITNIPLGLSSTITTSNKIFYSINSSGSSGSQTAGKLVIGTIVNGGNIFSRTSNPMFTNDGLLVGGTNFAPVMGGVDQPTDILAADLTGNGNFNIISASANDNKIAFYGNDNITQHIISLNADLAQSVTVADLDGDGDLDVISASFNDGKIAWYENKFVDTTPPTAVCQNITIPLDTMGAATIVATDIDGGSTDNVEITSYTIDIDTFSCADVGIPVTVTLTVSDAEGNSDTCTALVTVVDNEAPVALCQNITVQLDASGQASITASDIDGGSTDACGIASTAIDVSTFDCSNVGVNNVVLTVTDVNGNTSQCTAVVTVVDNEAPVAICQNITVQLDASGQASITASDIDGGSTDACGIAATSIDVANFDCTNIGPNNVILTVTDINGNTSTCSAIVTVEDVTAPELVCQNITVQLDANGEATIVPEDVIASNTDACGITTTSVDISSFSCSDIGTPVLVTVFSVDTQGNISSCTATVTVEDVLGPQFDSSTLPVDVVRQADENGEYVLEDFTVGIIVTDNCSDPLLPIVIEQDPVIGTILIPGIYDITLSAIDDLGNVTDYVFLLTVEEFLRTGDVAIDLSTVVLYPNPMKSILHLSNPKAIALEQLAIYDLTGRLVKSFNLSKMDSVTSFDVSTLASASYLVIIQSEYGTITKQLVME